MVGAEPSRVRHVIRSAAAPSRDPESTTCPVRGPTFHICQVGVNTDPSPCQTGTNELTCATEPTEDKTPRRPVGGRGPLTWLPHGATRRAPRGELGASRAPPRPAAEDAEVAVGPWGGALAYRC